jgi:FkbM family methyltransferase
MKISLGQHAKKLLRATTGLRLVGRDRLGVHFWHDFRRLLVIHDGPFLDVGANVGQWAADARVNFPNVPILSLEPEPKNFHELHRRFQYDRQHRAVQLAASNLAGTAELRISKYPSMHSLESRFPHQSNRSITIETETIDRIAQRFDLERLALLKIDVEGHEIPCIQGASRMLHEGRIDTVLVEVGFLGGTHTPFADVERILADSGLFFLAMYDLVPDYSGYARSVYANALFCRQNIRLGSSER